MADEDGLAYAYRTRIYDGGRRLHATMQDHRWESQDPSDASAMLLRYARGMHWKVAEQSGRMQAECLDAECPRMEFPIPSPMDLARPPTLGQWFFISSAPECYALAWYICPRTGYGANRHLFCLVPAHEAGEICANPRSIVSTALFAVRPLHVCIPILGQPWYDDGFLSILQRAAEYADRVEAAKSQAGYERDNREPSYAGEGGLREIMLREQDEARALAEEGLTPQQTRERKLYNAIRKAVSSDQRHKRLRESMQSSELGKKKAEEEEQLKAAFAKRNARVDSVRRANSVLLAYPALEEGGSERIEKAMKEFKHAVLRPDLKQPTTPSDDDDDSDDD